MTRNAIPAPNWYYFVWLCGDHITEQHIHNLDVANWFIGATPVSAPGHGRPAGPHRQAVRRNLRPPLRRVHLRRTASASTASAATRRLLRPGARGIAGTKGILYLKNDNKCYATDHKGNVIWKYDFRQKEENPYQVEHNELQDAILNGKKINNAEYVATSTMTSLLGPHGELFRQGSEMGRCDQERDPAHAGQGDLGHRAAHQAGREGFYPVPIPGCDEGGVTESGVASNAMLQTGLHKIC